jgi:hypothetical protein
MPLPILEKAKLLRKANVSLTLNEPIDRFGNRKVVSDTETEKGTAYATRQTSVFHETGLQKL